MGKIKPPALARTYNQPLNDWRSNNGRYNARRQQQAMAISNPTPVQPPAEDILDSIGKATASIDASRQGNVRREHLKTASDGIWTPRQSAKGQFILFAAILSSLVPVDAKAAPGSPGEQTDDARHKPFPSTNALVRQQSAVSRQSGQYGTSLSHPIFPHRNINTTVALSPAGELNRRPVSSGRQSRSAENTDAAPAQGGKRLAWLDLDRARSRINTPASAFMAAAQQAGMQNDAVERFMRRLGRAEAVTPAKVAGLAGSREVIDNAALLYAAAHQVAAADNMTSPAARGAARRDFVTALAREALQQQLFSPADLEGGERYLVGKKQVFGGVYYDGNALANAGGKTLADLADDKALMRLPGFARLTPDERQKMVRQWLDAHGQDTQYPFGTFENSMASVLKTTAMARGEPATGPYASTRALGSAFADLVKGWPNEGSSTVHPLVLFGLHFAKTSGLGIDGATPQERLASVKSLVDDASVLAGGPPRFDRNEAAIRILKDITHLGEAEITHRPSDGTSLLEYFFEDFDNPYLWNYLAQSGQVASVSFEETPQGEPKYSARDYLEQAEEKFNAELPNHPWFAAKARMELRSVNAHARFGNGEPEHKSPASLTQKAVDAKVAKLVPQYRAQLERERLNSASSQRDSTTMHWLKNTPIVSIVVGFGEGVANGDVDEIVSSVPVVGNLYNIVEGVATGDHKRATMAAVTLIPFVGSGYIIADGINNKDAAEITGGFEGLGLDFLTDGEGHLLNRVVGHSALGEGRVARTFAPSELPPAVRLQAEHSLGAMRDLGIKDRAIALSAKTGDHGTAMDPFNLAARDIDPQPALAREMTRLVGRMEAVPRERQSRMILRSIEGGIWQDPTTLARYARIGSDLYRIAKDDAASAPGHPIWNPTWPDGNGREPTIRLEHADGQWRVAKNVPGLKGGAPEIVLRPMNLAAAALLDLPVPEPYATKQRDFATYILGNPPQASVRVSQTTTVHDAMRLLTDASDLTRHADFTEKFDYYFDYYIYKARRMGHDNEITAFRDFMTELYDKSETFRALYNNAERTERLDSGEPWLLYMGEPYITELNAQTMDGEEERTTYRYDPAVDQRGRNIYLPTLSSHMKHDHKYITPGGRYTHLPVKATCVHEMVHVLTGAPDPVADTQSSRRGLIRRTNLSGPHYFGERGAVEYLTQRIMREASIEAPQRLTYVTVTDKFRQHMAEIDHSDFAILESYVKLQDDYLGALFPTAAADQTSQGEARASGSSGSHRS